MSLLQHIGKISSGLKYGLYFIVSRSQNQIRVSCHTFEAVDLTQTVNVYIYTACWYEQLQTCSSTILWGTEASSQVSMLHLLLPTEHTYKKLRLLPSANIEFHTKLLETYPMGTVV